MATQTTTQSSTIDPAIQPYLSYGLSEAQKLYQAGAPQYYTGQGYVSPSAQTQAGLTALQNRAMQGSPLVGAAQSQLQSTIQGNYLGGNPFFQGAFQPAAQAATQSFQDAMSNIASQASKAGRYGSGAMANLQNRAAGQLTKSLADTAGQLAYTNYADERARQMASTALAPQMAESDYTDINKLLAAGQLGEGYQQQALAADMAKYNYQQTAPQQQLANYLSAVYQQPMNKTVTTTAPLYKNQLATTLGTGLLGLQAYNAYNQSGLGNTLGNWLTGMNSPTEESLYGGVTSSLADEAASDAFWSSLF